MINQTNSQGDEAKPISKNALSIFLGPNLTSYTYSSEGTDTVQLIHCFFAVVCVGVNWKLRLVVNTLKLGYNDEKSWNEMIGLNQHILGLVNTLCKRNVSEDLRKSGKCNEKDVLGNLSKLTAADEGSYDIFQLAAQFLPMFRFMFQNNIL